MKIPSWLRDWDPRPAADETSMEYVVRVAYIGLWSVALLLILIGGGIALAASYL